MSAQIKLNTVQLLKFVRNNVASKHEWIPIHAQLTVSVQLTQRIAHNLIAVRNHVVLQLANRAGRKERSQIVSTLTSLSTHKACVITATISLGGPILPLIVSMLDRGMFTLKVSA